MSGRGPRLGKLQGLKREDDEDDPQAKQRRPATKGGIKVSGVVCLSGCRSSTAAAVVQVLYVGTRTSHIQRGCRTL